MSRQAKWALLLWMVLASHALLMAAAAAGLQGGARNLIVPFGSIDSATASSIAKTEAMLAFPLLIWFAVLLLRESE